ncbi:MAG: sodium:proton antiporter, partial [Myxococcota bacterium]|nr:sodium:proton antiporter [Myxococcota bacterium]
MPSQGLPYWTLVPFPALVVAIAILPVLAPRTWERPVFQGLVVALCALPVLGYLVGVSELREVWGTAASYVSFVSTLGALYVTSGGVQLYGEIEAKPSTNVGLVVLGAALASVVGSTGASMLLIRPLLWTNRFRERRAHLVPFFIIAVANVGGLLTPLGDPPLLLGYIAGVPFFWTLRLLPAWVLYVGSAALALYLIDRRAYAREAPAVRSRCTDVDFSIGLRGKRNALLLTAVGPAALLPVGLRELAMLAITAASVFLTPRSVRQNNGFSFAPIVEVAILFAGLFACLRPIQLALSQAAPWLPLHRSWQLFWAAGLCSTVLD